MIFYFNFSSVNCLPSFSIFIIILADGITFIHLTDNSTLTEAYCSPGGLEGVGRGGGRLDKRRGRAWAGLRQEVVGGDMDFRGDRQRYYDET